MNKEIWVTLEFVADLTEIYIMEIGKKENSKWAMLRRKLFFIKIDYNIAIMESSIMGYRKDSDIVNTLMEQCILAIGNKD